MIFLKKPKLIGWAYCHSFFCIDTWFISLQKKKLELTFRKDCLLACSDLLLLRHQAESKNVAEILLQLLEISSNVQGSSMIQNASLSVLCFTTKEAICLFSFSFKNDSSISNMFFLVKQHGHFMECSRLQRF